MTTLEAEQNETLFKDLTMKNISKTKIITGNDLLSGEVVYLTLTGQWSAHHHEAVAFNDNAAGDSRLNEILKTDRSIIGAYLADADHSENGQPSPVHFREAFRTRGPSNRFLGKQAA